MEPAVTGVMKIFNEVQEKFHSFDAEIQRARVNEYSFQGME